MSFHPTTKKKKKKRQRNCKKKDRGGPFSWVFQMLRLCVVRQAASTSAASSPQPPPPKPLKVLVLTMIPNGGAMTEALRLLGYNPYLFEHSLRKGHVLTHPQEWAAVLRREKPFSFEVLKIPETDSAVGSKTSTTTAAASPPPRYYDALVGPPATIAFESILKECPRSTRVILVEEPDKLAWEKDMDQWLRPLAARCEKSTRWWQDSRLHTMLLDMVDLRRALIDPATLRKGRQRPLPASSAAMAAQNVPLAQQQATLRLSGALDLFEQHVKEVVPSDRLLVYRVEEGWQPLCDFLHVPIPTTASASRDGAAAVAGASAPSSPPVHAHSVAVPNEPIPFPANATGRDVLYFLDQGVQKTNALMLLIVLSAAALGLLVLAAFRDELRDFYGDYRSYIRRDFEPYLEEEERFRERGEDTKLTTHKIFFLAKKSTQRFGEVYEREGGAAKSMTGVLRRFTGTPPAETKETAAVVSNDCNVSEPR